MNTALTAHAGRRLWNAPLVIDGVTPADRLTLSLRIRQASGRLLSWPADHPWLTLDRAPDGRLRLTAGRDTLEAWAPAPGWQTLAVVLDGSTGRVALVVDGRARRTLNRAPFRMPPDGALAVGPAVGDAADLAVWPDALGPGRLLDHHLTAEGLRPAPINPRIALTVRRDAGHARFGCPRFAPDGRWLAGCQSNALVFVDRATGEMTGSRIEHLDPLTAVDIDPTGRAVATADGGPTVQIWQAATQRPQTRLDLEHAVAGAAFSPDGRALAAWSPPDAPGRLTRVAYDVPAARPVTHALPAPIHHAVWRDDGQAIAVALRGGPPTVLGRDGDHRALDGPPATALAWHPTAPILFTGAADGSVWRHDATGTRVIRPALDAPRSPEIDALPALFSPDGQAGDAAWLIAPKWATFGRPPWRPSPDRRAVTAIAVNGRRIALADHAGATLMDHDGGRTRTLPHPEPTTAVALTDDVLLTGAADGAMRRFAATDGRPLGASPDPRRDGNGWPYVVRSIEPSPDGALLAVDHLGAWQARLLSTRAGPQPTPPTTSPQPALQIAVSPSGLQVVTARYDGRLSGWDLTRLRRVEGFAASSPSTRLLWTAEGPVSGHADGALRRWDTHGRLLGHHAAHAAARLAPRPGHMPTGGVDGLFALSDGTWVSSGRTTVRHWRGAEMLAVHPLATPSLQIARPVLDGEERVVISTITGVIRLDPRSGEQAPLIPPPGGINGAPVAFLAAGGPYVAGVRHAAGGQRLSIWSIARPDAPPLDVTLPLFARSLTFSPDGAWLAVAGSVRDGAGEWTFPILLLDPRDGDVVERIEGHRSAPSTVVFEARSAGALRLHTGAWDGHQRVFAVDGRGARLVERAPGCPAMALRFGPSRVALCADQIQIDRAGGRLTLVDDADGQWLIGSDDGLFAASREGDRLASAIAGPRLLGLDRVALARNRPDLIAARFDLGTPALRADLEARVRRRRARHGLTADPAPLTALPRVDLDPIVIREGEAIVRATARTGAGLSRWRVRSDGTPVAEGPLSGVAARFEARFTLVDGPNRIEVDVADAAGRWSPRARATVEHRDPRPPTLFVVAFGVSRYADPMIRDLRFAHQDALDLVERFAAAGPPWARVVTRAFTDEAVVDGAFDAAAGILATAAPRDTVILFVSGHGLYDRGGTYRYLTHDARLAAVEQSVPFERIEGLLDATPARRRLMLLDTCQSGELFDDARVTAPSPAAGPMQARVIPLAEPAQARIIRPITAAAAPADDRRDRFVDRDLRRGRGAVVFSSSRGAEASWELESLANGAFTEALLEGLAGAADPDGDGRIALADLQDHVARTVARLTADRQHPTVDRENRAARIELPTLPAP